MKKFNNKKGFTIVELVIVIAVIGVLTAVLVPTFVNLVNKANNASDESLVKNLNTQLRMKEQTEGKNKTFTSALEDAKEAGYLVENLTPKGGRDIVWNQDKDEFGFGDEAKGELYKYWKIYEKAADVPTTQTYSIYAKGTEWTGDLVYTVGFDAGLNEGISSVKYVKGETAKDDVRFYTNNGSLLVDADTDVVSHWSFIDKVDIKAIKGDSYHEYGTVRIGLEVSQGHVVVESEGTVNELSIPSDATDVSVQVENNAEVTTAIIDSTEATVEIAGGANVEQVIGETENITGAGAAEAKENAIAKTEVSNKAELDAAIADETVKYIVLTADINAEDRITIDRDLTVDGSSDKHTLTFSKENKDNSRAINVGWDNTDIAVALKNLKVVGPTSGGYTRGLNVSSTNVNLIVDNCEVSCKYYALNVTGSAAGSEIKISGSKFSGWAALNLWSSIKVDVVNSELVGTCISKGEGFATVCFEADTTSKTDMHVSDAKVTVRSSTIRTVYGYESGDGYQAMVGYNYSTVPQGADHNTFEAIGCVLEWEGPDENLLLVYDYLKISAQSTNVTIINGTKVESDTWYRYK